MVYSISFIHMIMFSVIHGIYVVHFTHIAKFHLFCFNCIHIIYIINVICATLILIIWVISFHVDIFIHIKIKFKSIWYGHTCEIFYLKQSFHFHPYAMMSSMWQDSFTWFNSHKFYYSTMCDQNFACYQFHLEHLMQVIHLNQSVKYFRHILNIDMVIHEWNSYVWFAPWGYHFYVHPCGWFQ